MKRSTTGDFSKNKKLCLSSSPINNTTNKMATTLEQLKDMVLHLDKGDLDYCITQPIPDEEDEDVSILLHKALRSIAQRQLKLETENKRYRIAIKQQHHLLTHDIEEEKEPVVNINKVIGTPEDCISSFRESPMLEKLQLSSGNIQVPLYHFSLF